MKCQIFWQLYCFGFIPNTIIDVNKVQRKPLNVYRFAQNSSPEAFCAYDGIFFRFNSDSNFQSFPDKFPTLLDHLDQNIRFKNI